MSVSRRKATGTQSRRYREGGLSNRGSMREPDGSRLTLGHLVQEPVWIRCLRQHEGHKRRSSYGKKEDASLVGLRPSRKKCPLVCDWVGLKAGAFLELEPLLGSLWPVSGT